MEPELPPKKCEQCHCEIEFGEEYYSGFGMLLCYECMVDANPEDNDYDF